MGREMFGFIQELYDISCFLTLCYSDAKVTMTDILQVVVAKEAVGNLGGLVRQLSLDQFENESRRMIPLQNDMSYSAKKFTRQKSPQGLHKKVPFFLFLYCVIDLLTIYGCFFADHIYFA